MRFVQVSSGVVLACGLINVAIHMSSDAALSTSIASVTGASGVIASLVLASLGLKHSSPVRGRMFNEPDEWDVVCSACGHSIDDAQGACTECGLQSDAPLTDQDIQSLRKARMVAIGTILAIILAAVLTVLVLWAFTAPITGKSAVWNLWNMFAMGTMVWTASCLPGIILAWSLTHLLISTTGRWWTRYPVLAFIWPFFRSSK